MSELISETRSIYPSSDIVRDSEGKFPCAIISAVEEDSPAYDAGFEPGCIIKSVNKSPLRDIIDWRWWAAEDEIELGYIDLDGEEGVVVLEKDPEEDWGFSFEGVVFDKIKLCRNACTFCFMRQLPDNMRPSLSLRDDDYRLSFLVGTFVTMTNITPEDEQRIVEQRISPLRVSLHAVSDEVRARLIGKHARHGIDAIERLLAQGIEMHAQIVLLPGENDGEELRKTLEWAYERPGIVEVGIVPLGYTRFQTTFNHSFNDGAAARNVVELVEPFQAQAMAERGHAWVFAADEFYNNAYGEELLQNLPSADLYGDFGMFEDGVGIIRSIVDDWYEALECGVVDECSEHLRCAGKDAYLLLGHAMLPFFEQLIEQSSLAGLLHVLPVRNDFFGGNVDVTGLLTGSDLVKALNGFTAASEHALFLVPEVVLNDNKVLLDDMTLDDVCRQSGRTLEAVSCNPTGFLPEIMQLL